MCVRTWKVLTVLAVCGLFVGWFTRVGAAQERGGWVEVSGGIAGAAAIAASGDEDGVFLAAGSERGIVIREPGSAQWRFAAPLGGAKINALRIDPLNPRRIFAATSVGIYRSHDRGHSWKRVFAGKNAREAMCRDIAVLPYAVYAATDAGIFVSRDADRLFRRDAGSPAGSVYSLAYCARDLQTVFAAASDGVYRSLNAGAWERRRVFTPAQDEPVESVSGDTLCAEEAASADAKRPRAVACAANEAGRVFMLGDAALEASIDGGITWEPLSSSGLTGGTVRSLFAAADSSLYALCERGVFIFRDGVWTDSSNGLSGSVPRAMAENASGGSYLATDKGIYAYQSDPVTNSRLSDNTVSQGPSIREVQDAAVRYAECEPEKIAKWRRAAARRAWFPDVTVGVNQDSGDLWHWESGSTTREFDDVLRKGNASVDWNVSLRWELGDIVWSDAQTAIDTRSRLTVELRNSILDEVTKLYFERKRLQSEVAALPVDDAGRRAEKELKAQELAASLDALTGGFFTGGK